jgi:23S rRNA pseudouridine1911/1915/1917 synthase
VRFLKPEQWNVVAADQEGERLDLALSRLFPELSRSRVQKLIEEGLVKRNGAPAKANLKLIVGDSLELFLPAPRPLGLKAENIPLDILFQDTHIAVVEKPAGLVVHPGAGHEEGTLVNALLHHFPDLPSGSGIGGALRPGIVHRIDRQTSGILLITKTDLAHQHLSQQFKEHSISRRYRALCWGKLASQGEWNDPIGRDPKDRKRMAPTPAGRTALTRFKKISDHPGPLSLVEAELFTGRTHQIRVHFSAHGFPVAGDTTYTHASRAARRAKEEGMRFLTKTLPAAAAALEALHQRERQFLHAIHLGFTHPVTGERLNFSSELPPDLREVMVSLDPC